MSTTKLFDKNLIKKFTFVFFVIKKVTFRFLMILVSEVINIITLTNKIRFLRSIQSLWCLGYDCIAPTYGDED